MKPVTEEKRVLVLARGALGDVMVCLPFLAALPGFFKSDRLTLAGNPATLKLLAELDFVAEIMDHDRAAWAGLYSTPPELSPEMKRFILSHRGAAVFCRGRADPAATGLEALGMAHVVRAPSRPPAGRGVHLLDHVFNETGVPRPEKPVLLPPPARGLEAARKKLEELGLEPGQWLALHPGSGGATKNWPLENWIKLAKSLIEAGKRPAFILGPAEGGIEEIIGRDCPIAKGLDLTALAGLLSLSRGFVGHDSGVAHLAASLGLPTLALFGPTNPVHWAPRGPRAQFLAPPQPTGDWGWLNVEMVLARL